jgi:hypothetical protein
METSFAPFIACATSLRHDVTLRRMRARDLFKLALPSVLVGYRVCARAELDRERRRDVVAVGELLVAVAVGFLARDVEAIAGYSFGC